MHSNVRLVKFLGIYCRFVNLQSIKVISDGSSFPTQIKRVQDK